jgi:c(7)-type cytochrome triheme protein
MKPVQERIMKCGLIVPALVLSLIFHSTVSAVTVKDAVYLTKNAGKVVFSHTGHIRLKGMANDCRVCHDAIFDLKRKRHFSMVEMEKGLSCGACHDGIKAFGLKECARCHQTREVTFKVKATGPTGFSHTSHLATSGDCGVCHPSHFAAGPGKHKHSSMTDMEKGKSCGACHNGRKAFGLAACVACHPAGDITYKVKETGPTHFSHKTHIEVEKCGACHPKLYAPNRKNRRVGMAAMEKGLSCGACHNSRQAFSVKECSKCHPTGELLFEEKSTGNVMFSHTSHTGLYRCGDCHTSIYETTRSKLKVSMQEMEKGRSCGACHEGKTAFNVSEKCESCHKM